MKSEEDDKKYLEQIYQDLLVSNSPTKGFMKVLRRTIDNLSPPINSDAVFSNKSLPVQPLYSDHGRLRFVHNSIVRYLLDAGPFNMNTLADLPFPVEDRRQFAQLIGYSLSGFGELPYVDDATYISIADSGKDRTPEQSKILYYESLIAQLKELLREPISKLFEIHPDDLKC